MFRIGPEAYVAIAIIIILLWPFLFIESMPIMVWIILVINLALFIFTYRFCSAKGCTYTEGLTIIAAPNLSGCANVTIIYLPIFLIAIYLLTVWYAILGIRRGKTFTEERWIILVNKHYNRLQYK